MATTKRGYFAIVPAAPGGWCYGKHLDATAAHLTAWTKTGRDGDVEYIINQDFASDADAALALVNILMTYREVGFRVW
jgi:hypothetical protein